MKQKIFEYAILWHPNEKQTEDGQKSKILKGVDWVMANDERSATLMVAREIPANHIGELDQIEVAVRPF